MRTHITPRQIRRIATGFAAVLFTSICVISLASRLRAEEDPPEIPMGQCTITYFAASPSGPSTWLVDGLVEAEDMSAVSITLGGAAIDIGTLTPDAQGFFAFELAAFPYDYVSVEATDGTETDSDNLTLYDYF